MYTVTVTAVKIHEKEENVLRRIVKLVVSMALVGLIATAANAGVVSFSATNPAAGSNWAQNLSISGFDSSLGTLTSVELKVSAALGGEVKYEAINAYPTSIGFDVKGKIVVGLPDASDLTQSLDWNGTASAAAYDGTFDWLGTSGGSTAISAVATPLDIVYTDPAKLSQFVGASIVLPTTATFKQNATCEGSVITWFDTKPNVTVDVIYTYAVPEPGSLLAIASGVIGLVGMSLKRRK